MYISKKFIDSSKEYLNTAKNILILSHKNPDGDAVGSGLALYHFLNSKNYNVNFVLPNDMPDFLSWLPGAEHILNCIIDKEKIIDIIKNADIIFMLDFNHFSRIDCIAEEIEISAVPKIMIDHHPQPQNIYTINYTRTSSSSTAEMMYEFIDAISNDDNMIDKKISECLFVGIMTDTGCFSYNSSNYFTFNVVAKLLSANIDKDLITNNIYNNYSESRLRLLGFSINQKMKVLPEYKTAYIFLTRSELKEYKFKQGDTEGFVNYPLSIKGIVFTVIFLEKDGYTKCSFRSVGNFPANKIANEYFNGGGHLNAAGGEFKGSVWNAVKQFEEILPNYYEQNKSAIYD